LFRSQGDLDPRALPTHDSGKLSQTMLAVPAFLESVGEFR
jgi:hypothetical protein